MSQFIQNIIKGKGKPGAPQTPGEFDVQAELKKIQDHLGFLEKKIDQLLAGGGQNRRPSHHRGGGGFDRPRGGGFRGNRHGGGFRGGNRGGDDRGNRSDDRGNQQHSGTWKNAGNDGFRPRKQHFPPQQ